MEPDLSKAPEGFERSSGAAETAGVPALAGFLFAIQSMITLVAVDVLGLSSQAGSGLRLALSVGLFGLAVVAAFGTVSAWTRFGPPVRWAIAFVLLSGCSLFWTEASSPAASAAYWMGTACNLGVALVLMRGTALESTARAIMKGFVAGALVVALTAWMMPAQPDLRLGDEDFLNANTIAYVCGFAALFTQYLMRGKGRGWAWILLLLAGTILRSVSKTTIVAFLVSEAWVVLKDGSMSRRSRAMLAFSGVVLLIAFSGLFVAYFDLYTSSGNQAETLTGRTGIWAWALEQGLDRPWLGHGFDSLWKVAPVFGTFEARHAENELLQEFYTLGAVGVMVATGCYWSLWRTIRKAHQEPGRVILSGIVLFVIVRGLAEAEPFDLLLPLWMVAMLGILASRREVSVAPVTVARTQTSGVIEENVIRL